MINNKSNQIFFLKKAKLSHKKVQINNKNY